MRTDVPANERMNWATSAPFLAFHLIPLAAVFTGVSARALVLCAGSYFVRMFFITAGYHRYFAHRSFRMGRLAQAVMAFGGTTSLQKGPLWWAAHHRDHHRYADTEQDVHSPIRGFWWSHVGWILCDKYGATNTDRIKDFAKFPELRWLDRNDFVGPAALAVASFLVAGWSGLVIGFGLSTILLWHGTFAVNSLAHVMGRRRYATTDTSRNSALIAVVTNGEGWHNNHHHFQASARQGFHWWQWDPTFYVLWGLARLGVVQGLRTATPTVKATNRIDAGHFDIGLFRTRWHEAAVVLSAAGVHAIESLASRRHGLEARIEAARHDLDAYLEAQRHALGELGELLAAARRLRAVS